MSNTDRGHSLLYAGQAAEAAADVRRVLVVALAEQAAERADLRLVLVVAARPELGVVEERVVIADPPAVALCRHVVPPG